MAALGFILLIALGLLLLVALWAVVRSIPDFNRYRRIRKM